MWDVIGVVIPLLISVSAIQWSDSGVAYKRGCTPYPEDVTTVERVRVLCPVGNKSEKCRQLQLVNGEAARSKGGPIKCLLLSK